MNVGVLVDAPMAFVVNMLSRWVKARYSIDEMMKWIGL
jgi:hypothetical protein